LLSIRAEKAPDARAIRAVHLAAFAPRSNEADLVDLLRQNGQATISLVALEEGRLAGHVLFSPIAISPAQPALRGLGLGPLAVLPELQRHGIGTRLAMRGLEVARDADYDFAVLLGAPAYYQRFGFRPASGFGLDSDYQAGDDFMAVELRAGALTGVSGHVQFRPEFKQTGC
jgi:putative acetyltransferase